MGAKKSARRSHAQLQALPEANESAEHLQRLSTARAKGMTGSGVRSHHELQRASCRVCTRSNHYSLAAAAAAAAAGGAERAGGRTQARCTWMSSHGSCMVSMRTVPGRLHVAAWIWIPCADGSMLSTLSMNRIQGCVVAIRSSLQCLHAFPEAPPCTAEVAWASSLQKAAPQLN
jgi:aminoglycoside phosphotransferase